jgi:hypothetical protein
MEKGDDEFKKGKRPLFFSKKGSVPFSYFKKVNENDGERR